MDTGSQSASVPARGPAAGDGPPRRGPGVTRRRLIGAAAAAALVFAAAVALRVLYRAHVVAEVDGTTMWAALHGRLHVVVHAWRMSLGAAEVAVLYVLAPLAAAALVLGGPFFIRLATPRRRT